MSQSIVMHDLLKLNFDDLMLAKSGRVIKLIQDKQPLNLSTVTLYLPFGVSKYKKQWSAFEEYSVDCYINDSNNNTEYVSKLTEFNDHLFNLSKSNLQLFGLHQSVEVTNSPFYRDNKTFPKLLKLQLPRDQNGNFTTQFFDENSKRIIVNEQNIDTVLSKKTLFKSIITCSKVWAYQNKIGSIWNVLQLKLVPLSKNTENSSDSEGGSENDSHVSPVYNNTVYTQSLID